MAAGEPPGRASTGVRRAAGAAPSGVAYRIGIVGAGPVATYALERLAALFVRATDDLEVTVFERTGDFGSGATHSHRQVNTSYMNRIVAQIALGADESVEGAEALLPPHLRPTFATWCERRFAETGDSRYAMSGRDVPRRNLHGEALQDAFARYARVLQGTGRVTVELVPKDVVDIDRLGTGGYLVHHDGSSTRVDSVLLVTGHAADARPPGMVDDPGYIAYPYPLEREVTQAKVPPSSAVGIDGAGLTAIDIILHLSEGRGGEFEEVEPSDPAGHLVYRASGSEPRIIYLVSPSGMPTRTRPLNDKLDDRALEHAGVFLTIPAIEELRHRHGVAPPKSRSMAPRQLDFDRHVFPLVILEMAYVYYRTLLGSAFAAELRAAAGPAYATFLAGPPDRPESGIDLLLEPSQAAFEAMTRAMKTGSRTSPQVAAALARFDLVLGPGRPWGHSEDPLEHRFDWRTILDPMARNDAASGPAWATAARAVVERDLRDGRQGNLLNPTKAACDGVWRDLRGVFSSIVDHGGLTPRSHRRFIEHHLRTYNRLSNGAGLEPSRKLLALIDSGLVSLDLGPSASVERRDGSVRLSCMDGTSRIVDVLIRGRLHAFDPRSDRHPLYPNLLRHGLIRQFQNTSAGGQAYTPGGIDLEEELYAVDANGHVLRNFALIGVPADGVRSFQATAARPNSGSDILRTVSNWANGVIGQVTHDARAGSKSDEHQIATRS